MQEISILTSPFLPISKARFSGPIRPVRTNIGPGPDMDMVRKFFFQKIQVDFQLNTLEKNRMPKFENLVPKKSDQKSASARNTIKKSWPSCNSSSPWFVKTEVLSVSECTVQYHEANHQHCEKGMSFLNCTWMIQLMSLSSGYVAMRSSNMVLDQFYQDIITCFLPKSAFRTWMMMTCTLHIAASL